MNKKEKARARALKAWETIRKKKSYNKPEKNHFRSVVAKRCSGNGLVLDTPEFLFSKSVPKSYITIFEHDERQYKKMFRNPPQNVEKIYLGDISAARLMHKEFHYAFLDFCDTFESNKDRLIALSSKLASSDKIAITFSLRNNRKRMGDYKFDMAVKLMHIFPFHEISYAEPYRDGCPMIGLILSNKHMENSRQDLNRFVIYLWCEEYARKTFYSGVKSKSIIGKYGEIFKALPKEMKEYLKRRYEWYLDNTKFDKQYSTGANNFLNWFEDELFAIYRKIPENIYLNFIERYPDLTKFISERNTNIGILKVYGREVDNTFQKKELDVILKKLNLKIENGKIVRR